MSFKDTLFIQSWRSELEANKSILQDYYHNHLLEELEKASIFVFTPAKVGGSSIRDSIMHVYREQGSSQPVYLPMLHDLVYGFNRNLLSTAFYQDGVWPYTVEEIKKVVQSRKEKIKIITLFRDPVARNLSSVFEAFKTLWVDTVDETSKFSHIHDLINYWLQEKIYSNSIIRWFDEQLYGVFELDILEYQFDKQSGFCYIENEWAECLILRTDKIDDNQAVLQQFCGMPELTLTRHNTASEKWYNELYKSFISSYKPDTKTIDMLYNNPVMDWFFTAEEIEELRNKWIKKEGQ